MKISALSNVFVINLGVNKILISIFCHKEKKYIYIYILRCTEIYIYCDVFVAIEIKYEI